MQMTRNRLTDNDTNWGPLTIGESSSTWRPWGIVLASGCDEYPGCSLSLYTGGRTIRLALPAILQPWRSWVDLSKEAWATVRPDGTKGYWDIQPREFGFRLSDGFLQVFLGPQTNDSVTTKSWCKHLPWTQWRHVRHSFYDLSGDHAATVPARCKWEQMDALRNSCPVAKFEIEDFDGARIVATTRIEEREWRFGTGWFKWLSIFRKPRIQRSLDISYDKEVGPEKGSWKGGLMGHGIDLRPGELHEAAFRRLCIEGVSMRRRDKTPLKFIGRVA